LGRIKANLQIDTNNSRVAPDFSPKILHEKIWLSKKSTRDVMPSFSSRGANILPCTLIQNSAGIYLGSVK
jgi:hypothetical protein